MNERAKAVTDQKHFAVTITGVFLVLSYVGIVNHEPWRDEYQAWLVARDAHSFSDLLHNLRYEGNPVLWHSFLWVFTKFTHNPFVMQVFHILVSAAFVYLLNRYAPFSRLNKVLFTFGYYSFFEFNLISRSYGLGFLLGTILLVLYKDRANHYLLLSFVLFLLANTHVFGLILSLCFSGILIVDYFQKTKSGEFARLSASRMALSAVLIGGGWITSALQIYPKSDSTFPVSYTQGFDWVRMKFAIWRIVTAYFALPCFSTIHWWNTTVLDNVKDLPDGSRIAEADKMYPVIPLVIFLIFAMYFLRKPLPLLFYTAGTMGLVYFFYYSRLTFSRYTSHLTVVLVASMWLAECYSRETNSRSVMKLSSIGRFTGKYLFTLILAVEFAGGIVSYAKDLRYSFSSSAEMTEFLKDNHLEKLPIIGITDFVISPAAAVFDRTIFYPQRNEEGSFIIWDSKRRDTVPYAEILERIQEMARAGAKRIMFITDAQPNMEDPFTHETKPLKDAMISESLHIQLLKSVPPGIVADEKYYIYLVEDRR